MALYSLTTTFILLPAVVAFGTIFVAVPWTERIHWKIKILIAYLILPEVVSSIYQILVGGLDTPCYMNAYIYFFANDFRFFSIFLCSLFIYLGLKVGLSKLNQLFLITVLVAVPYLLLLFNLMLLVVESFEENKDESCYDTKLSPFYTA